MPAPICPAPITPTVSILTAMFLPSKRPKKRRDHRRAATRVQSHGPPFFHKDGRTLTPNLGELRRKLGERRVEVGDEAVVGDLENRRLLVLVDGDDDLRILHAGQMLDRPRYADRYIE